MPPSHGGRAAAAGKTVVHVHESRLKKKKHGHAEEGSSERWLLTYADMITLLLALFIILFAISTPNKVKYAQLARAMSGGFGGTNAINVPSSGSAGASNITGQAATPNTANLKYSTSTENTKALNPPSQPSQPSSPVPTTVPTAAPAPATTPAPLTKALEAKIKAVVKATQMQQKVHVHLEGRGLVISLLSDSANYNSGSAELRPETLQLLHRISAFLGNITNDIRIEGNTDNVPIETAEYPSNWELSSARAVVVTRFLVEHEHLDGRRFSAVGHGQFKPAVGNDTPIHRQLNRRVDIVIMNTRP